MVGPMRLVKVDIIGLQPAQAFFDRGDDIVAIQRCHAAALG